MSYGHRPSPSGSVAGLLGEPRPAARCRGSRTFRNCRVRIHSNRRAGRHANLKAALRELGVRVVKNSPDLTVTLVNDYLERQLAELNMQQLSDSTRWLLVQPSGVFPLVGPVFSPGESALLDAACSIA